MTVHIGMILENEFMTDPRVRREAEYLSSEGYQLSVLTPDFNSSILEENYKNIKIIRFRMKEFIHKKFRPLIPSIPLYTNIWRKKIIRFIETRKIEILHVHDLPLMKLSIEIGKKHKIPVVGDFHENFTEAIKMYYWANTFKGKLLINFDKWDYLQDYCVRNLDKIVVVADETINMFADKYHRNPEDIYVVDNSIDIQQFISGGINEILDLKLKKKYKGKIVIGYIGGILPNRGLHYLFNILPQFSNENIKVVIVGRGQQKKELFHFLRTNRIQHLVDWYEWQPFSNIMTFISNFDIGITRLERNLQNDFTTPNKVFQYMFMEKPILTADSLPMRRIVGLTNSGLVFKSGNEKDLKEKLTALYKNENLRKEMGQNGKKAVLENYNWKKTSKGLVDLYNAIEI